MGVPWLDVPWPQQRQRHQLLGLPVFHLVERLAQKIPAIPVNISPIPRLNAAIFRP